LSKETKKLEKAHIAADLVYYIRGLTPPGRFLKEESDGNGVWWDIGDAKAFKKVGQALREDAPGIRGPDLEGEDMKVPAKATNTPSLDEIAPIQTNRTITTTNKSSMVGPSLTTGASSSGGKMPARGGKLIHSNMCGSQSSGQQGVLHSQQHPVVIDLLTPEDHQTVIQQQPKHRGLGFRDMAPLGGTGVSGATATVIDEFEIPGIRNPVDESFGCAFHQTPQGESYVISGLSGGGTSAVSGMSGISTLTDPFSSISNSDVNYQTRAAQVMRLNQARQNWASSAVARSDNQATDTERGPVDVYDNMSWMGHSLLGGGLAHGDSFVFAGAGSIMSGGSGGNYSFDVQSATVNDRAFLPNGDGAAAMAHGNTFGSTMRLSRSGIYRGTHTNRGSGGPAAYFAGNGSVASMSIASNAVDSIPDSILSGLSEHLIALDLARSEDGSILDQV
jgi:hypothetical protein